MSGRAIVAEDLSLDVGGPRVFLQVGVFDIRIKHEDEGVVIDVFDKEGHFAEAIATCSALDSDAIVEAEEG